MSMTELNESLKQLQIKADIRDMQYDTKRYTKYSEMGNNSLASFAFHKIKVTNLLFYVYYIIRAMVKTIKVKRYFCDMICYNYENKNGVKQ